MAPQHQKSLRIAAFGIRSIPPRDGAAGADTCAMELFERIVARGHHVTCYNRIYKGDRDFVSEYKGIHLVNLRTVSKSGFDSFIHSFRATLHIIVHNTGDVIHIANGGNSVWALVLRLWGKKVFVCQDGIDWKRKKWPWYGKLFLYLSTILTAKVPNGVIFDNIYAKEMFEKRFGRKFSFVPNGSEARDFVEDPGICRRLNLQPREYLLFIGRFIPDKGLHYLVRAFEEVKTSKKLVMVGGSPNVSSYERAIKSTKDARIIFPGYIYGNDALNLIKHAYLYIQPSDIEGLSPVILTVMSLGTPLLCSDIRENLYVVDKAALTFVRGNTESLREKIQFALDNPETVQKLGEGASARIQSTFNWERAADQHIELYLCE